MEKAAQLLVFTLDGQRYALLLSSVERVVRSIEITPLPKAPEIVLGVVNIRGRIVPVIDIRKRFRLPEREIGLGDHLIVAHTVARRVALVVDSVVSVLDQPKQEIVPSKDIVPGLKYLEGVLKLEDGMVLIYDLDRFFSLEEEKALEKAIKRVKRRD